jgi:hypothetical protein
MEFKLCHRMEWRAPWGTESVSTIRLNRHGRTLGALAWTAALAFGLGAGGASLARPKPWLEPPAYVEIQVDGAPVQRGEISLQQAIEMARRRYPGRVVRADTTTRNGRVVHEIRILGDDNRVRDVQIDAQSTPPR